MVPRLRGPARGRWTPVFWGAQSKRGVLAAGYEQSGHPDRHGQPGGDVCICVALPRPDPILSRSPRKEMVVSVRFFVVKQYRVIRERLTTTTFRTKATAQSFVAYTKAI